MQIRIVRPFQWSQKEFVDVKGKFANIGCGYNKMASTQDYQIINIDNRPEVEPDRCCDVSQGFPFENEELDGIIMSHFLEHFDHDDEARTVKGEVNYILSECHRTLKPDGELIITVPSPNDGIALRPFHKTCYSLFEWYAVFHKNNFIVTQAVGVDSWIHIEGIYDLLCRLAIRIPFLGKEYAFILKKK